MSSSPEVEGECCTSLKRSLSTSEGGDSGDERVLKRQHSGTFRSETIEFVTAAAERLKALLQEGDAADINEVLDELCDYVVDEKVLERTKIGLDVSSLQKHADSDVASKAKMLVAQWKRDRETRNKVVKGFADRASLSLRDARRLEEGVFNASCPMGFLEGEGKKAYQRHFIRLSTHLKDGGPGSLVLKLRDGELDLEEVAFMADEALLSDSKREKVHADREAGLKEALSIKGVELEGTPSNDYTCPRCSSARCVYKELQTGWHNDQQDTTILVHCLECQERWKASDDHGGGGS